MNANKNKLDEDFDENSLEYARNFKPKLRFDIGEIVYLNSDLKRKNPLTIAGFLIFDDCDDYVVSFSTSQRTIERAFFKDKCLTK